MSPLIVLEGIDLSGKGTIKKKLKEELEARGIEVCMTEEPWSGGYREQIKEILKQESADKQETLDLFIRDHNIHEESYKKPNLDLGKTIIEDRDARYSIPPYQGAQGFSREELLAKVRGWRAADLCIYIDISAEESMRRKKLAQRGEMDNNLLFENLEFQKKVRAGYWALLDIFPEMVLVNGIGTEEEVFQRVLEKYNRWESEHQNKLIR